MDTIASLARDTTARRLIVLGASNVRLALPTICDIALGLWGPRLEIMMACGHGRSYGQRRSLLWRELPGIIECGLWPALNASPPSPTAALVTDIGNDILYDVPVSDIIGWIGECLDRLSQVQADIMVTPLPLRNLSSLSQAKFLFLRTVLYPACRLGYRAVLDRASDLDERLRAAALTRGIALAEPQSEWYGFDHIHIRRRHRAAAWSEILKAKESAAARFLSRRQRMRIRSLIPERRWVFGREQRRSQPDLRLPDGSTLALY